MMGSGKTTVGKALASLSGFLFMDTDVLIEKHEDQSIQAIFDLKGEAYFRSKESEICSQLSQLDHHIIATGGGIILKKENRISLKKSGYVVYLSSSPETLYHRLLFNKSRPLLQTKNKLDTITKILKKRESFYHSTADTIIKTDSQSADTIAKEIWTLFLNYSENTNE